jgi:hypothetical protein
MHQVLIGKRFLPQLHVMVRRVQGCSCIGHADPVSCLQRGNAVSSAHAGRPCLPLDLLPPTG